MILPEYLVLDDDPGMDFLEVPNTLDVGLTNVSALSYNTDKHAGVVKLVDTTDSKSVVRKYVSVRVRPPVEMSLYSLF